MKLLLVIYLLFYSLPQCFSQLSNDKVLLDTFYICDKYFVYSDPSERDNYFVVKLSATDTVELNARYDKSGTLKLYRCVRIFIQRDSVAIVRIQPRIKFNTNALVYRFPCDTSIALNTKSGSSQMLVYKEMQYGQNNRTVLVSLKKVSHCKIIFETGMQLGKNETRFIKKRMPVITIAEYNFYTKTLRYLKSDQ